jgi:hypothetical protein
VYTDKWETPKMGTKWHTDNIYLGRETFTARKHNKHEKVITKFTET